MTLQKFKELSDSERMTYLWVLSPVTGHFDEFKKYLELYVELEIEQEKKL